MKRIDFSRLNVETSIGVFETVDLRSALGNAVFYKAPTLEQDALARKIFYSQEGGDDFSEDEYTLMMQAFKAYGVYYAVIRSVEKQSEASEASDTPTPRGGAEA